MGISRWLVLALLLPSAAALGGAASSAPDLDALVQRLARPAPATTPFVEVHFSPLLSRPLMVSGELEYDGPDALARTVDKPYSEHTRIQGDTVTVTRGSGKPRIFSLQRAPELKILLSSFAALLGGDRQQLEQGFTLALSGDEAHWSLALTPRDSRVSQLVSHIVVSGAAASTRCMFTTAADGSVTVMLMEDAARTAVPADIDRAGLDKVCH
ncbi:MAG: LolA-related protein [Steroidobacteraceae bacterium]